MEKLIALFPRDGRKRPGEGIGLGSRLGLGLGLGQALR